MHGPYKDLTIGFDRNTHLVGTTLRGAATPVTDVLARGTTLNWAFAIGECGAETLAGLDAQKVADANIPAFNRAGVDYVISTGGEGGLFTCGSDAGMGQRHLWQHRPPGEHAGQRVGLCHRHQGREDPRCGEAGDDQRSAQPQEHEGAAVTQRHPVQVGEDLVALLLAGRAGQRRVQRDHQVQVERADRHRQQGRFEGGPKHRRQGRAADDRSRQRQQPAIP